MSRLGSTSGTGGPIGTRGPARRSSRSDRRHIGRRIAKLRRDVKALGVTRDTKRASRQASEVPQVAIAGYTNAGKSTLMRRLTGADVIVADQLFATLDPTTRKVRPAGRAPRGDQRHRRVRRQAPARPRRGVPVHARGGDARRTSWSTSRTRRARRSTEQIDAVRRVLDEIGAGDIPEVLALNKIDRVAGSERVRLARRFPGSVPVSALTGEGVDGLLLALGGDAAGPPGRTSRRSCRGTEATSSRCSTARPRCWRPRPSRRAPGSTANVGLRALAALRRFLTKPAVERVEPPRRPDRPRATGSAQRPVNGASGSTPRGLRQPEGQDLEPHHRGDLREDGGERARPR